MNIVGKRLYAIRKLLRVRDDVVAVVPAALPKVIDEDILVAGVAQPAFHHGIGGLLDELLGYVALEHVPRHPAHGRGWGQLATLGCRRGLLRKGGGCHHGHYRDKKEHSSHIV